MSETDFPSLTPQELARAGQALYGAAWRAQLARAFGVEEADIIMVASGGAAAPSEWRAKLVALAQDMALRALEAASNLMWREDASAPAQEPLYAPQPPRFA